MIIIHVVEPFAAGIAVFVKALTETMPDDLHIIIHGERKPVLSAAEVKKTFPKKNVRFIKWHSAQRAINPWRDMMALGELYTILDRLNKKGFADAVHLHSSKGGILGRAACRLAGIKNVIYTPNGASFLAANNRISSFFYKTLEKIGDGLGGTVVCCSKSEHEAYQTIGIPARYVNNGINTAEVVLPENKKNSKFRIVTSGRIEKQKNPVLFNEIATYFQEFENFEFIWAGDGDMRPSLTASNITITGWLQPLDVKKAVSTADIYISTSKYEGLSFGILEALALHKPVLLSDCVGNRDVIKKGVNGDLYCKAQEAIMKILKYSINTDMLKIMGTNSAQLCHDEFNQDQNFADYRKIYTQNLPEAIAFKVPGHHLNFRTV